MIELNFTFNFILWMKRKTVPFVKFIYWKTVQFVDYTQFRSIFSLSFNMNSNYLRKLKFNENVDVMVNFERLLTRNCILVPKTSDDYVNNKSIDRKRAFIAYTQNINIWLFAIKFQILALFRDQRIDLLLGNPSLILSKPEIALQGVAFLCYMIGFYGNIPWYLYLSINLWLISRNLFAVPSPYKESSILRFDISNKKP